MFRHSSPSQKSDPADPPSSSSISGLGDSLKLTKVLNDLRDGGFFGDLKWIEAKVFMVIVSCASRFTCEAYPSVETIAESLKIKNPQPVREAIQSLVDRGILKMVSRGGGFKKTRIVEITCPPWSPDAPGLVESDRKIEQRRRRRNGPGDGISVKERYGSPDRPVIRDKNGRISSPHDKSMGPVAGPISLVPMGPVTRPIDHGAMGPVTGPQIEAMGPVAGPQTGLNRTINSTATATGRYPAADGDGDADGQFENDRNAAYEALAQAGIGEPTRSMLLGEIPTLTATAVRKINAGLSANAGAGLLVIGIRADGARVAAQIEREAQAAGAAKRETEQRLRLKQEQFDAEVSNAIAEYLRSPEKYVDSPRYVPTAKTMLDRALGCDSDLLRAFDRRVCDIDDRALRVLNFRDRTYREEEVLRELRRNEDERRKRMEAGDLAHKAREEQRRIKDENDRKQRAAHKNFCKERDDQLNALASSEAEQLRRVADPPTNGDEKPSG